jgi:hypothetical protein
MIQRSAAEVPDRSQGGPGRRIDPPQLGRAAAQGGRGPGQSGHPGVHPLLGLLAHGPAGDPTGHVGALKPPEQVKPR